MILSRVADALYWMGRYLERAENTTRLLLVTEEVATEVQGLDAALARAEWRTLGEILPGAIPADRPGRQGDGLAAAALPALSLSSAHPHSVYVSLKRARDNARTVREALTVEVFVNLNETYRDLESHAARRIADAPTLRGALSATHRGILSTVGAIEHTLTRDPGWLFLKLGESLERVYRTAVILRVKLPGLLQPRSSLDLPVVHTRWRALLRSLSSLENYRQASGARLEPLEVLHFLLFNAHSPRSLRHGAAAVKDCLDRLGGPGEPSPPARLMGGLAAALTYQGDEIARGGDYVGFLDRVRDDMARTHDAISALYFGT